MNTANLQLQGVLAAISALLQTMERKGTLSRAAIDAALDQAVMQAVEGARNQNSLKEAHLEAIRFPARYLRMALSVDAASYESIACAVAHARPDESESDTPAGARESGIVRTYTPDAERREPLAARDGS